MSILLKHQEIQLAKEDQQTLERKIKDLGLDPRKISFTYDSDLRSNKTYIIIKAEGKFVDRFLLADPML